MEKRLIIGLGLGVGLSGFCIESSHALMNTKGVVNASALNLRSVVTNEVIDKLVKGTEVTIIKDLNNGFVQVRTNKGKEGKCAKNYLSIGNSAVTGTKEKYVVDTPSLNVRKGVGTGHAVVGYIKAGDIVNVVKVIDRWAQIEYSNGKTGYCAYRYLKKASSSNNTNNNTSNSINQSVSNTNAKYANIVSSYTTSYSTGSNRSKNVELAARRINNTIIKPNETFSFKKAVGKLELENGYFNAPYMANGVIAGESPGGGVCQVSSTLYVSALKAGLTKISARTHSGQVAYMPAGFDAVISSSSDLKITNTYKEDIVIKASYSNGKLTIKFASVNPLLGGKIYELKSQPIENSKQYKLFLFEKNGNVSKAVYSRTSNYVR